MKSCEGILEHYRQSNCDVFETIELSHDDIQWLLKIWTWFAKEICIKTAEWQSEKSLHCRMQETQLWN